MGMLSVYACVVVRLLHLVVSRWVIGRTQRWRVRVHVPDARQSAS